MVDALLQYKILCIIGFGATLLFAVLWFFKRGEYKNAKKEIEEQDYSHDKLIAEYKGLNYQNSRLAYQLEQEKANANANAIQASNAYDALKKEYASTLDLAKYNAKVADLEAKESIAKLLKERNEARAALSEKQRELQFAYAKLSAIQKQLGIEELQLVELEADGVPIEELTPAWQHSTPA